MASRRQVLPHQPSLEGDRLRQGSDSIQRSLNADELFGGRLFRDVEIAPSTSVKVFHGLGRKPTNSMFMHIRSSAASIDQVPYVSSVTVKYIEVTSDEGAATLTMNVWVK